jgi:hypothetical protein
LVTPAANSRGCGDVKRELGGEYARALVGASPRGDSIRAASIRLSFTTATKSTPMTPAPATRKGEAADVKIFVPFEEW